MAWAEKIVVPHREYGEIQNTVAEARRFLEQVQSSMLGAFVSMPEGSKYHSIVERLRDTETTLNALLIQAVKAEASEPVPLLNILSAPQKGKKK